MSRIIYWWANGLFVAGKKAALEDDDMIPMRADAECDDSAETQGDLFSKKVRILLVKVL